jgi:hypothetical protein
MLTSGSRTQPCRWLSGKPRSSSGEGSRGGSQGAARSLQATAAITPRLTEPGRAVVLYTQFGAIRIRLLERLAPRITGMVWALAAARNCTSAYRCAFYRCADGSYNHASHEF